MFSVIVFGALACVGAITLWAAFWKAHYRLESGADEVHFVATSDGWRIALSRYRPLGSAVRRHPVLLCHGLASSHMSFDASPDVSLARHLAERGYDVWAIDLRGHGLSERPAWRTSRRYEWTFDDYLEKDLPAAIDAILHRASRSTEGADGPDAVHWIGHSMGGLLLYASLGTGGSARIRFGIAIGSSLNYSAAASDFHRMIRLQPLARFIRVIHLGTAARLIAPFAGWFANPIERFNWWSSNTDGALLRRMLTGAYANVPTSLLVQLSTAFSAEGLASANGSLRYSEGLNHATTPVLAIAGDRDRQCAPEAARVTLEAVGSAIGPIQGRIEIFGTEQGHQDHYGHCDLLMGLRVVDEVFPVIDEWLDRHD